MRKVCDELAETALFRGIRHDFFEPYCIMSTIRLVWKGEILINEGDICNYVGVVSEGQLAMQKYTGSGEAFTLGLLGPGDVIGSDMVFGSDHISPTTIEAVSNSKIIILSNDLLMRMMQARQGVEMNFIQVLSDRIRSQNKRISLLSQKSLRQKIAYYLLDIDGDERRRRASGGIPAKRSSGPVLVRLPASKEVVSRLLAMPRPSFSRELINMEKDGLIHVNGRSIQILSPERLERDVLENLTN
jgi:CRP-like cAMP-binding protein